MYIRSLKLALVLLLAASGGSALAAWAQSTSTGTVAGSVSDSSGAVVEGASVALTDTATNVARSTTTNATGRYIYVDVNPGVYNVVVSKPGFETTKTASQEVKVGTSLTVNLTLQVGAANVVVEVSAVGNELQTMNATVGNTITNLTIDNLPSLGRDVSTFIALQPGVSPDGSVAGTVVDQSAFTLDGGDNTNDMDGSMSVYTKSFAGDPTGGVANQNSIGPAEGGKGVGGATGVLPTPQDSVEEFKVNTAGQTADFNSSSGSEVKVVTKRGTDAWHGTAYEYYKDNNWSSNSWQNNFSGVAIPSFHYSRYGGAVGGPLIPKEILGGKTYFFFNYEGFNFPNSETIVRNVPSPTLQLGLLTDDVTGALYNLNPTAVVYNGITYPGTAYDPRAIGINPLVQQIWNKYEPASNAACTQTLCDHPAAGTTSNVQGFSANLALPTTSKFAVGRLDHDFSSKWHFMSSYRWFELKSAADSQVDIGGFFSGDTLGTPASQSNLPQQAFLWTAGLTTNISTNTTNDLHYSFLRNFWQWKRTGDTPQTATLGGALEIDSGQSAGFGQVNDLGPYNVDTQNTRNRFWDGHDQMLRDDVSTLKGNHLFTFGGTYEHNWDYHQRTDNGGGINNQVVYELGDGTSGSLLAQGGDIPLCLQAGVTITGCKSLTAAALGIVSISQVAYTRSGSTLTLNPIGSPAFDKSTIPYYNVYFSDTWHMKPTFTLTYGLGWTLEMPPVEANGKQVELVDSSDQPISGAAYLDARKRAALQGQAYNPEIGFALLGNTANSPKYPYNPFYGSFSPRIAAAWSPHFDSDSVAGKLFGHEDTVLRAGYGRIFGRLNGVNLVLVPLLGPGLLQPTQCLTGLKTGSCGAPGSNNASTAFRIGVDGLTAPLQPASATLPQPYYPGVNGISAATSSTLDQNFRPNEVDSFNLTIQRQLSRKVILEVGYIGRRITHEYQPINLNAVPYMMTQGGQQFAQAYKNVVLQLCGGLQGLAGGGCGGSTLPSPGPGPQPGNVQPQPFFEKALGGPTSAYCSAAVGGVTPTSCTNAVVLHETGNLSLAQVWSLWSDLDPFMAPVLGGTTMMNTTNPAIGATSPQMTSGPADIGSVGYGNYNGGFASLKMADWRGLTLQSNFTYSKALGTGALVQADAGYTPDDPFNLGTMYGNQTFNRKFVYNFFFVYQPPFFKGQSGLMGRALGGWTFSTVFSAGAGAPIDLFTSTGGGQEYGAGDNANYFGNENSVPVAPATKGHVYSEPDQFPNFFKAGPAAINDFRNPILGLDNKDCGYGCFPGLPYWNMDLSVRKNFRVTEGISLEVQGVFANVFNHNQFLDPGGLYGSYLSPIDSSAPGSFGTLSGGSAQEEPGGNRQIEVGARVRF